MFLFPAVRSLDQPEFLLLFTVRVRCSFQLVFEVSFEIFSDVFRLFCRFVVVALGTQVDGVSVVVRGFVLVLSGNERFSAVFAVDVALFFVEAFAVVVSVFGGEYCVGVEVDVVVAVFAVDGVGVVVAVSVVELVVVFVDAEVVGGDCFVAVGAVGCEVIGSHCVLYNEWLALKE